MFVAIVAAENVAGENFAVEILVGAADVLVDTAAVHRVAVTAVVVAVPVPVQVPNFDNLATR